MARTPVVLNVYNIYWLNEYTSSIGLGVYHSGVEVFGREYAFGGHPFEFTGIFDMEPKDLIELGEGFTFKETVVLGFTDFIEADIINLTEMLGKTYIGSSYHLVKKNCNHFSNELSQLICGKSIPNWVNRLAAIGTRFPFLAACIPKEWLTPDGGVAYNDYVDLTEWEEIDYPPSQENEPLLSMSEMLAQGDERTTNNHTNNFFRVRNTADNNDEANCSSIQETINTPTSDDEVDKGRSSDFDLLSNG